MLKCDILKAESPKHKEPLLETVSTTCGSGWVNRQITYRMLIIDPPLPQVVLTASKHDGCRSRKL